ncbi:phosphatidylserine/phosphatidylglycerophosphate/cardiolipin synthase family protein [Tenebrionicola larvae]|jgi:phosphatidylserine/phosphatidylglycerophosphate/cardiolipin synthase-like enzyme|uniref:Phosphatidylserine/phosphatidylglycerophosphate/ cardiolipin synthase family protein n=1 Tax=Tenebrionicola larvae TaxID=2815733 RepID=A0A949QB22_9ENTR|nr:phosphatidylserine/phosphatidylglycerophosphate/cardiolipin synthase family protein [Tenebrionicola larvae]MBV5097538.1 phosphatidylserine/phosphatidylglycerophosphate/cardiolipin synthase family protein [Tenebrionicola larvae]
MSKIIPTPQVCRAVPGQTQEVIMTPQWLPEKSEYPPCRAAYTPLINGARAFEAVARAIEQAKISIDIITWGFQASMYFQRPGGKMIGELLEEATKRNVRVRVLVWFSGTGQLMDPNFPGWESFYQVEQQWPDKYPSMSQTEREKFFQNQKSNHNRLLATGKGLGYETEEQYQYDKEWHYRVEHGLIPGLEVCKRDLADVKDLSRVSSRLKELSPYRVEDDSSMMRDAALGLFSTHHQKMVMVDYEDPTRTVGFVMGHNMLSQYWDDDKHSRVRKKEDEGRDGFTGWQDISACVFGEILWHMNENFVDSWEKDAKDGGLKMTRAGIPSSAFLPDRARLEAINQRLSLPVPLNLVMGQICRTQPQYKRYDILKAYMESVKRARNYIYIENQYFRFHELAKQIRSTVNELIRCGRDPERHGPLYLFVVTNSTEKPADKKWPSNAIGGHQTYKMLEALGRQDLMPKYTNKIRGVDPHTEVPALDIPGLKTIICTLVSPDSEAGKWQPVYVHSKLMLIDDIFLIQGSANINLRSMAFDSEIAIALQDTDQDPIVPEVRRRLWGMYTGGKGVGDDFAAVYEVWERIINSNSDKKLNGGTPDTSLIKFSDNSTKLINGD